MGDARSRFMEKVEVTEHCWVWTGTITAKGYGIFRVGTNTHAHRWSYEHYVGPIPDGLVIDHLCRNRACVNPRHLEPVTNQENLRRAMQVRCPSGHLFTPENTRLNAKGHRVCRTCHNGHQVRYRARRSLAALGGQEQP